MESVQKAVQQHLINPYFIGNKNEIIKYAEKLTITPGKMAESDVSNLKFHEIDDGQILELNQIFESYLSRSYGENNFSFYKKKQAYKPDSV